MTKSKEVKTQQKFSKEAFVDAAEGTKERLILQAILEDGKTYTKDGVAKLVEKWKTKEVK